MPYNPKYNETAYKYRKTNLKRIPLDVQKDYYDNVLKPAADRSGTPVNRYIRIAIDEKIDRDKEK